MDDGRLTVVKSGNGFTHVAEDSHDFRLSEARLQAFVHQLQNMRFVKRHKKQDFIDTIVGLADARVHITNNVLVAIQS